MLKVKLLGQFDGRRGGIPIAIPSRAAQSLLAYLLLTSGSTHRREMLAGLLWPDTTDESARRNLRHELWRLRKAIEPKPSKKGVIPYLLVDDISLGWNSESEYWLDATAVQEASGKTDSADELLETLALYRGELLPGFYDEWVVLERERVRSVYEQKMARLLELLVEGKRWQETLEWGERWIALGNAPEPAYRALMLAHSANGNISKVAAVYERCVQALRNDLGVEPSEQTQTLFERLSKGERIPDAKTAPSAAPVPAHAPPEAAAPIPASTTTLPHRRNLPVPLTSFIGREREMGEVKRMLSTTRLLTLIGTGGMGKTRLAIQVATDLSSEYKDGAWWVDLVALSDPALVPQAVAKSLGILELPNVPLIETLADALCSRHVLLVLDNCEHLVSSVAQLADTLLGSCASLRILTTSREALSISGEMVWRVPSLSLPQLEPPPSFKELDQYESARLFVERARAANSELALTERNALPIAQICERLDGIPLAIELAAARVKTLSVQQIATRLDDRFNLLTRGSRTALPRHQTLRATIDWSYELLSEPEKILYRRLSVFAGGWTLEAAEAVCASEGLDTGQVLGLLERLVDKSLVIVEEREGAARYRMLETIRQYATERLTDAGESDAVHRRHLVFYLQMADESGPKLLQAEQSIVLDRLELEIDNLRTAVDWAQEHQVIAALRLVSSIPRFWFIRAHHKEGLERLRTILSIPEAKEPSLARLNALNAYLFMLWPEGQLAGFQPVIDEALALGAMLGDRWNTAYALLWQGVSRTASADNTLARSSLEQSLGIFSELGDTIYSGWVLVFLGEVELLHGNTPHAEALYEQAIPMLEGTKDYPFIAIPLRRLGQLALFQGDLEKAGRLVRKSLENNWAVHDYRGIAACLAAIGALGMANGQTTRATALFGAADTIVEFIRTPILLFDQQQSERNVAAARAQLDPATFEAAWVKGRAMSMEQAIAYALEQAEEPVAAG